MKKLIRVDVICCAVLLLAFFVLPWVDFGIFSINGYQIPDKMRALGRLKTGGIPAKVYVAYLLYLIPTFSVWIIINAAIEKKTRLLSFFNALVPIAFFIYAWVAIFKEKFLDGLGVGSYITILS